MMDIKQAENLGRRESLRMTLYFFLLGELIMLLLIASGDFANGILFFLQGHMNIDYLIMVTILFVLTYFFGQRNGKEILILGKNFFLTPLKYGLITIWITLAYLITVGIFREYGDKTSVNIVQSFIVEPYVRTTFIFIVPLAIYAYYCGTRIKANQNSPEKK